MTQSLPAVQSSVSNTGFGRKDKKVANRYIYIGYLILFLFLGSVVAWSAYAPISSAAIASGLVGKDGYRKTVQHLEGGIIHQIFIKEGDNVKSNQELISLEDIQSKSDYDLLRKQKIIALTKEACLIAESKHEDKVSLKLPSDVKLEALDNSVRDAIDGHIEAFYVRRELHKGQLNIIDQRILQAEEKITHVFNLKRDRASNETDKTSNQVETETTRQEINNLQMEKSELVANNTKRIVSSLDSVRDQLVNLDEKLAKTEDRLERTVIRAPIEGVVVDLRVNTIGGVIQSGEPLLDIVPEAGKLIIEAQVDPRDRDTVRVGQDAEVRFTAFNQRITEPVPGKVVLISADRLVDQTLDGKQLAYYKAKIELLEDPANVMNGAPVYPGMQADVMIITGDRTALQYFLKPIVKSFNRAFRDD